MGLKLTKESESSPQSVEAESKRKHKDIRRIHTPNCDSKPPCAVIVTILQIQSYDDLFRVVPQTSPEPEVSSIALFESSYDSLRDLIAGLNNPTGSRNPPSASEIEDIISCIGQVEPDCVLFNFECCAHCSEKGFGIGGGYSQHDDAVMQLLQYIIDHKHSAMFGDFSLKALIHDWREPLLGPNPFISVGDCNGQMTLKFNPSDLADCPFEQLKVIGSISDGGTAVVHTMAETIAYTVDIDKTEHALYDLKILTIAQDISGLRTVLNDYPKCRIGDQVGLAGHVLLTYPSGASIITSAGHWIELSRVNASEDAMMRVAQENYGSEFVSQLNTELSSCSSALERDEVVQKNVKYFVQSSAPSKVKKSSSGKKY